MIKKFLAMATIAAASMAHAEVSVPGLELVLTVPEQTTLSQQGTRDVVTVWCEMFNNAKKEIALEHYYAANQDGDWFDKVLGCIESAGRRGVKIRFLLEESGVRISDKAVIDRLKAIPGLEFRLLEWAKINNGAGINHSKFMIVDRAAAYVGSQNFDWRSVQHIHEMGLKITEAEMVSQVQAIFEQDWAAEAAIMQGKPAPRLNTERPKAQTGKDAYLVASPWAFNPPGVGDSESELVRLLDSAKQEVRVQLLNYKPIGYGPNGTKPYYDVIDRAIRMAAYRGVKVKLMLSHWDTDASVLPYLKSLAVLPNIEIRFATIPQLPGPHIAFARVIHSKTMVVDGQLAWLGTSNWAGGYFDNSRNLEIVMRQPKLVSTIAAIHEELWSSKYAEPLDLNRVYPAPKR